MDVQGSWTTMMLVDNDASWKQISSDLKRKKNNDVIIPASGIF